MTDRDTMQQPTTTADEIRPSRFEALVVDFGGVLTSPLQEAMAAFASDIGIELQDLVRVALRAYSGGSDSLVTDFETGKIAEDEFAREFAARLSEVTGSPVPHEGLVRRVFSGLHLEEEMLELVATARASGFKTGLLSNSWGTELYPRRRLEEIFDVMVISGEVGLRKPDPEIYRMTASKLGVPEPACVFVDDHPGHLVAAQEVGMTTVLHRTPAQTRDELGSLLGIPLGGPRETDQR